MTDVVTGEAVVLEVPLARYPSRLVAQLIDVLLQLAVLLGVLLTVAAGNPSGAVAGAIAVSTLALVIVGYPAAFETLSRGKSLGKLAMGLRVVGDDGGPERFRQALVRALAAVVEIWLLGGAPALICSLLSDRGKRLGDVFAGTFVIQERLPRRPDLPPGLSVVPLPLLGWAQHLELSGLTDQAADDASSYLRRYHELTPAASWELGHRIAATVAAQVTPAPPPGTPPADFLSAVLAVRRNREAARLAAGQQRRQPRPAPAPSAPQPGFPHSQPGFPPHSQPAQAQAPPQPGFPHSQPAQAQAPPQPPFQAPFPPPAPPAAAPAADPAQFPGQAAPAWPASPPAPAAEPDNPSAPDSGQFAPPV
ncbi:MAG TPA: RDD family protein [Streptosporangiaceae bacterium]